MFSGRTFSSEDIELIKWARRTYPDLSRHEFASTVCELINWNTLAGRAKRIQCLAYLEILEEKGILKLPSVRTSLQRSNVKVHLPALNINTDEVKGEIMEYQPIHLDIAHAGSELKRWRAYINNYHMLGDKKVFGSCIRYFVKSGDTELGCLQFSASSWALEFRDKWIGWTAEDRKARLNFIVNNSRFLIFPWVHIKNLASKVLSLAAKQLQQDWLEEYCYAPVLIETFVDLEHFKGTCYKAANWMYIGKTKGRGRMDQNKEYALSQKAIFMYPLQKDFKECLRGEKSCKVVNPDE